MMGLAWILLKTLIVFYSTQFIDKDKIKKKKRATVPPPSTDSVLDHLQTKNLL